MQKYMSKATWCLLLLIGLCTILPLVNAEDIVNGECESPTTNNLVSVFMVSASDGWAVGNSGWILKWSGTVWVPEFPAVTVVPLLFALTLILVILTKKPSKKLLSN